MARPKDGSRFRRTICLLSHETMLPVEMACNHDRSVVASGSETCCLTMDSRLWPMVN